MFGDKSGYDLKLWMSSCTSNFFDASFGSIYPALKRLEAKDLIRSVEQVESGKFKKIYSIREAGKKEFMAWLSAPILFHKDETGPSG